MKTTKEIDAQKYRRHRKKILARSNAWYEKNPEKALEYRVKRKKRLSAYAKEYNAKLRAKVMDHYGRKCTCCGETEYYFLSVDHINGGGNKHRKMIGSGVAMYRWIVKNKFPKDLQVLCFNCNLSKGFRGKCPHKK